MGLLDDLKEEREKEESQLQPPEEASDLERKEEIYQAYIRPEFKALFGYLQDLTEQLNHIHQEVLVEYRLPRNIRTGKLMQKNYEVTVDASDQMHEIQIRWEAVANNPFMIPAETDQAADRIKEKLRQFGLISTKRDPKNSGYVCAAIVEVTPRVPVSIDFVVDKEKLGAWLVAKNYVDLGVVREFTDADDFGEEWHEEIGELILRKSNKLISSLLSEEEKEKLRKKLYSEHASHQEDLSSYQDKDTKKSLWKRLFNK